MRYALLSIAICICSVSLANDWLTLPSTYSHDVNGTRVSQYAPIQKPQAPVAANFRSSGYTHTRSSLNYGASSDNYHRVQRWGEPVRPYGEWRFPYRPYSTPYPNWGAPFAGFNAGFGGPGFGFGGVPGNRPGGGYGKPGPLEDDGPGGDKGRHAYPRNRDFERGFLGDGNWPSDRYRNDKRSIPQASPFNPYPAGPGTPYPVAPYYDGYYPNYRQ